MWTLVMILLSHVPGISAVTVLQTYATVEECQTERNRIGFEMAEAYPHERDFVIACELDQKYQT